MKPGILPSEPLQPTPSMSQLLGSRLRAEIEKRALRVGDKFPTDAEIAAAYGVSRTVVREAVAALREAGLISTQRGRGSIVIANTPSPSFSVSAPELENSRRLLQLYEFRTMIEAEAAALAAERHTDDDSAKLRALVSKAAMVQTFEDAIHNDIAFHLAIAEATRNEYFQRVMATVRSATTARPFLREDLDEAGYLALFRNTIRTEHSEIADAVASGDASRARDAIKSHLGGQRYERLLIRLGGEVDPADNEPETTSDDNDD